MDKNTVIEKQNNIITWICFCLAILQYLGTFLSALLYSKARSIFWIIVTLSCFGLFGGVYLLEKRIKRQLIPIFFIILVIFLLLSSEYFAQDINWWPMLGINGKHFDGRKSSGKKKNGAEMIANKDEIVKALSEGEEYA